MLVCPGHGLLKFKLLCDLAMAVRGFLCNNQLSMLYQAAVCKKEQFRVLNQVDLAASCAGHSCQLPASSGISVVIVGLESGWHTYVFLGKTLNSS